MHQRILLLGCTGINKIEVANKIRDRGNRRGREVKVIDFERSYVKRALDFPNLSSLLTMNIYDLTRLWDNAWNIFTKEHPQINNNVSEVYVLSLHGVFVDSVSGIRVASNIEKICQEFKPDLVITLIEDVYNIWWRTEARVPAGSHELRPTLEQLLMARRAETIVGDYIVASLYRYSRSIGEKVRHVMLSVNHPVQVLERLIFDEALPVYISFPISAPRRLMGHHQQEKQNLGEQIVHAINEFHHLALKAQATSTSLSYISPLAIDELPFGKVVSSSTKGTEFINFDVSNSRWSLDNLWGNTPLLSAPPPPPTPIKSEEVEDVQGLIKTDVGWRDARLALQSRFLAVFSPVMPQTDGTYDKARGVIAEIEYAIANTIPCYIFQDPRFDPEGMWEKHIGTPGTMGPNYLQQFTVTCASAEELFSRIKERAESENQI